jgi:magnesium transporter
MNILRRPTLRFTRRRHDPGTAPGTIHVSEEPAAPLRMRLVRYDLGSIHEADLLDLGGMDEVAEAAVSWLDVEGIDGRVIAAIGSRWNVHPLALEDMVNVGQRPKVEDYEDSLFIVLQHFFVDDGHEHILREQISLLLQEGRVLSVQERSNPTFDPVRERLRGGKQRIRGGGAGYLAYALIDTVVDHLFPVLDTLADRIESTEGSLLSSPTRNDLDSLHLIKRDLLLLRKSVWPLRDMINTIMRLEMELVGTDTHLYLRDVADHASLALDIIETYREMVASLTDLYLSSVSNRLNEVMKVLTIIATIFIPLSFIAGVYGMNFSHQASPWNMPELEWHFGYPGVLAVMAAVAGGLLLYFYRKGWL